MLTSDQKGNIAEAAVVSAAVKLGIDVYKPVGEGGRYDMIFEIDGRLLRIQCKWARRHGDVIRCALLFALGMPLDHYSRIEVGQGSISTIHIDGAGIRVLAINERPRLV